MIFLLKSYLTMRKSVVKRVCMGQQALSDEGTAIFRGAHNDQPIFDFRDGNAQSFTMIIIPEDLNISSTGLIQVLAL